MKYYEPENHDPDVDIIRHLLQAGKPVNLKTEIGNRALCEAAEQGNLELMTLLLDNGADPNGYFDPVETRKRHLQLLPDDAAYLASDASDRNDDEGETTQCLTDMLNETPIDMENIEHAWAQQLTSSPCDFEIPLFMAAQSGSAKCVSLLINRGADVNQRDNSNQTALWYATNEEVINLFLKQGPSIEDHDWVGYTPLIDL